MSFPKILLFRSFKGTEDDRRQNNQVRKEQIHVQKNYALSTVQMMGMR